MNNRHYELRKWLIIKTRSVLKAQPIYENIKDWDRKDIELYQSLFDGNHNSTIEKMNFVKGTEKFKEEMSKQEKISLNEKEQTKKTRSIPFKFPTFEETMLEISRSRNNERISKTETNTEYAIIISVSALILSFLAFLFSLAKG